MRRLMEYKIISKRVVEIRRCLMPTGASVRKPRGTRRAGSSSEQKIRANEKQSRRNLARVINCNFEAGDLLVSLKYDERHLPPQAHTGDAPGSEGYAAAETVLGKYLTRLRREYRKATGHALRAVWVTANHSPKRDAPARLHHHLLLPADAMELSRKLWEKHGGRGTFMCESLDNRGDHSDLAGYLYANVAGELPGKRRWSCSRGMERPIYTEPVEVADPEEILPEHGSVIRDVELTRDEDGRVTGSYLRCLLDQPPKVRGGQIVLPKRGRRRP